MEEVKINNNDNNNNDNNDNNNDNNDKKKNIRNFIIITVGAIQLLAYIFRPRPREHQPSGTINL